MACMEHCCINCGHQVFNNYATPPKICPVCDHTGFVSMHDEVEIEEVNYIYGDLDDEEWD